MTEWEGKRQAAIRAVEATGDFTRAELARLFGCDERTVGAALPAKSPAKKGRKTRARR